MEHEPRSAILYARIKPSNKKFIENTTKRCNFRSESECVDAMISLQISREEIHARNARRARRSSKNAK